jgi:hypothetical protein
LTADYVIWYLVGMFNRLPEPLWSIVAKFLNFEDARSLSLVNKQLNKTVNSGKWAGEIKKALNAVESQNPNIAAISLIENRGKAIRNDDLRKAVAEGMSIVRELQTWHPLHNSKEKTMLNSLQEFDSYSVQAQKISLPEIRDTLVAGLRQIVPETIKHRLEEAEKQANSHIEKFVLGTPDRVHQIYCDAVAGILEEKKLPEPGTRDDVTGFSAVYTLHLGQQGFRVLAGLIANRITYHVAKENQARLDLRGLGEKDPHIKELEEYTELQKKRQGVKDLLGTSGSSEVEGNGGQRRLIDGLKQILGQNDIEAGLSNLTNVERHFGMKNAGRLERKIGRLVFVPRHIPETVSRDLRPQIEGAAPSSSNPSYSPCATSSTSNGTGAGGASQIPPTLVPQSLNPTLAHQRLTDTTQQKATLSSAVTQDLEQQGQPAEPQLPTAGQRERRNSNTAAGRRAAEAEQARLNCCGGKCIVM